MKVLWPLGGYFASCMVTPDVPVKGVAVFGVVVTMPTSEVLAAALLLVAAFELRVNALVGCSFF